MNTEESLSVREHPKMPRLADYRLIAFDMDSTLINIECVDEIADAVNKKEEVAAITEAAMQGIISDYKESLRQRVALLKGVPEHTLQAIYDERLQLNPGAEALMDACKQAGLKTLLVSGGFTFFTERIRTRLGVDFTRANKLEIELDKAKEYATVKRVEMLYHGTKFNWRLLKSTAAEMEIPPIDVFDANYGTVKAYHSEVWREAYAVNIG